MKKLTEEKIIALENWAKSKKDSTMTPEEKTLVARIEEHQKNNWEGVKVASKSILKERLESLKRQGSAS
jgi:hypothetical protein